MTADEAATLTAYGAELARLQGELLALGPAVRRPQWLGTTDHHAWIRAQALVAGIGAVALEVFCTSLLAEDVSIRIAAGMAPHGDIAEERWIARTIAERDCRERPTVRGESARELLRCLGIA
jgi:hypothetical protein